MRELWCLYSFIRLNLVKLSVKAYHAAPEIEKATPCGVAYLCVSLRKRTG
jgi:hypothetical protein